MKIQVSDVIIDQEQLVLKVRIQSLTGLHLILHKQNQMKPEELMMMVMYLM